MINELPIAKRSKNSTWSLDNKDNRREVGDGISDIYV